ncbi:MAG: hypothetical protein ACYC26_13600 [Phycisphaerales bacterium]
MGTDKATLSESGNVVQLEDFTADLEWPYPLQLRVITHQGRKYLYYCTRGNGLWRRELKTGDGNETGGGWWRTRTASG